MAGALSVLLMDDDDLFRAGLRTMLEPAGIAVVADARASNQPSDYVARHRCDVVLIDPVHAAAGTGAGAPQLDELVRTVQRAGDVPVVVLSESGDAALLAAACRAGARGYLLKRAPVGELVAGIRAVAAGHGSLSPELAAAAIALLREGSSLAPQNARREDVSARELDVLRMLARGCDNAQIAAALDISALTVKNHLSSIFAKLGFDNRVQAAVFAVRSGLA